MWHSYLNFTTVFVNLKTNVTLIYLLVCVHAKYMFIYCSSLCRNAIIIECTTDEKLDNQETVQLFHVHRLVDVINVTFILKLQNSFWSSKRTSHWLYLLYQIYKCSFIEQFLVGHEKHSVFESSGGSVALSSTDVATSGKHLFDVGLRCRGRDQVYCHRWQIRIRHLHALWTRFWEKLSYKNACL